MRETLTVSEIMRRREIYLEQIKHIVEAEVKIYNHHLPKIYVTEWGRVEYEYQFPEETQKALDRLGELKEEFRLRIFED